MIDEWTLGDVLHKLNAVQVIACLMASISLAYTALVSEPTRANRIFYRWILAGVVIVLGVVTYVIFLEKGHL